ncbi:bifunctional riboflavin kinase/FAD synthetase [Capnocytophaga felis]|uniref:Riboflavin biosynthesis protein n=1 Tax=Capnocytophaga felis TaxID=2267611 RepID=A0A5M4BBJ7_9FLAO|nr:bifunctional riboflavin kinase/FAD synthetase [Capnocytophaga felis]GET46963.1 riboflavin biosynthesis protein [Capnocytophaga felis]GET49483.1 riboflavin biosynthesis protein [Capnocytophaga felis]
MKEITDIFNFTAEKGSVITIGTFDGVHLGHRKIIKKLVETAKNQDLLATIFTFFPHPRMVVHQDSELKLIHTLDEKKHVLKSLGINQLVVCPFNDSFSKMSAETFVEDLLVKRLKAKKVIIGYDHRFGRNRTADISDMRKFGEKYGFEVEEIPAQEVNEVSVSSTKIRKAISEGDIKTAWEYLGVPFCISGKVIHGLKIGRTISYPTANIQVKESYKLIPKDGIYLVYSFFNGKKTYGMMSIGKNPTIEGKGATIEVHYFDFDEDIYGNDVTIYFLERLRNEQKFESVEKLKEQLQIDEATSRKLIKQIG